MYKLCLELMWFLQIFLSKNSSAITTNLALKKTAYVREFYGPYFPSNGVDGDVDTKALCNGKNRWFVVDLGMDYRVHYVALHTRKDCCGEWMSNFKVGLLRSFDETNFQRNELCGSYEGQTKTNTRYKLNCPQPFSQYRYVSLHMPDLPYDDMSFAEFEVHGDDKADYSIKYVGCYADRGLTPTYTVTSIDQCIYICSARAFIYAGVKAGSECVCQIAFQKLALSSFCTTPCSDDPHICGGNEHYSVYSVPVCREGGKEVSCTRHCSTSGVCSGTCEAGWTGTYCHVRDCTSDNGQCGENTCKPFSIGPVQLSECVCEAGYEEKLNYSSPCTDIDECLEEVCHTNTTSCNNTLGSYECLCIAESGCSPAEKAANVGVIVGGVVGCLALLILSISLLIFCLCKRNKNSIRPGSIKSMSPSPTYDELNMTGTTGQDCDETYETIISNTQQQLSAETPQYYKLSATLGIRYEEDIESFWTMVIQNEVSVVIMLARLKESSTMNCVQYWPLEGEKEYGSVRVRLEELKTWPTFQIRQLLIRNRHSGKSFRVSHLFYLEWPPHAAPSNVASLLNFHHKSKLLIGQVANCKEGAALEDCMVNVVVHCSSGLERTGTLIAVDNMLQGEGGKGMDGTVVAFEAARKKLGRMLQNEQQVELCQKTWTYFCKLGHSTIFSKHGNSIEHFLARNKHQLIKALQNQIQLIKEAESLYINSGETVDSQACKADYYPGFSRPQAFRLQAVEEVLTSQSLIESFISECSFLLVLGEQAMIKVERLLPANDKETESDHFKFMKQNSKDYFKTDLVLKRKDLCVGPGDEYINNSESPAKRVRIKCVCENNNITDSYRSLSKHLQDVDQLPILVLYCGVKRQDCLWDLVKLHLMQMADTHGEVDVYQAVYNVYNPQSFPRQPQTPHIHSSSSPPQNRLILDVASYKKIHLFGQSLLKTVKERDLETHENGGYEGLKTSGSRATYQSLPSTNTMGVIKTNRLNYNEMN